MLKLCHVVVTNASLIERFVVMRSKFYHICQKPSFEYMVRLAGLVDKLDQVIHKVGIVTLSLNVQLIHLLLDFFPFILEPNNFSLSLSENLIYLTSPFFVQVHLLIIFLKRIRDSTRRVDSTLNSALHEPSDTTDRFCNDTNQTSADTFGNSRNSIFSATFDRLCENTCNTIKNTFENSEAAIP